MAIYPTPTGYRIQKMHKGVTFRDFVKGIDNASLARQLEAQAVADIERGITPTRGSLTHGTSLTLEKAYDDAWEHKWFEESDGYKRKIEQGWNEFQRYFVNQRGIMALDKVDTAAIDGFIKFCKTKSRPNAPKTINNKLGFLSSMLSLQVERGALAKMPVIHWQSVLRNERPRWYSPWEERQILEHTQTCPFLTQHVRALMHDFFVVLFDTGMRPWREAASMQKSWLRYGNDGERIIRIPKSFSKTNISRDIPVMGRTLDILLHRTAALAHDDVVFKGLAEQAHVGKFWTQHLRPSLSWGKEEVAYCMRHTFATRLVECDVNLKVIQELMGHSDIAQTVKYAKATDKAKRHGINQLNKALPTATT